MKLKLPMVEDLKQFNIRLPEGLKSKLTELREQCDRDHLDFNAALTSNLRTFAASVRAELATRGRKVASKFANDNDSKSLAGTLSNGDRGEQTQEK
jgi:hypothetical protein